MTSSSVVRLFVGSLVVCCLVASVFGAAITVTFTGGTAYTGTSGGNCPYAMTAGNTYTFNSNSASIDCAISGTPDAVTFGTGGSVATYANSNTYSQTGAGTLSVSSGQSVSFLSFSYTANGAVTIDGTLSANSVTATTGALTVSSTGTLQSTAGALGLTAATNGNALTLGGSLIATGANLGIVNFAVTAAAMTSLIRASGNVIIAPWATTTLGGPISSTGGNIQINPNAGSGLALTVSGTVINSNPGGFISLGNAATTSLTVSGPISLNNGQLSTDVTTTATFSSPISGASNVFLPNAGTVTITASGSFGFTGNFLAATSGTFSHAGLIAGNSSSTIDINPSGATTTITGVVQCLNPTIGSNVFRIRPTGTTVSFSSATIITPGEVSIGNTGATTYAFTSSTLNFGNRFTLTNPTTFTNPTFVTTNWNVQISGGSSVAGPSGTALPFTFLASSNAITSSLFPSGINTNCIWVQAPASTTSFAVTLPNAIQYRNYVQASPNALTVTSTNGGAVTRCAPLLTSVLDRRNDVFKNNLVYFGGNAVFYFVTNQALPFGTITASDFTVSGGSITSVTSLGGSPTAFAIVVSLTCDGVVSLSYNGSLTGNGGNFLGISSGSADRVVNAKCIANIYAPCG